MITYFQAIVLGLLQGFTELFPISSLGHSVIFSWLFNWNTILADETKSESFFLSFLVAMHVATGLALFIYYRKIWYRIFQGLFQSLRSRKIESADSRLGWLLIVGTIPAGLTGLLLEHHLRAQFAKPLSAIIFLFINGIILLLGDQYLRKHPVKDTPYTDSATFENVSEALNFKRAVIIGTAQVTALFAGISRSGVTMVSGLYSGLNREDAARFSFLLATPIIFAAGIYKLPDFFSNLESGTLGQILAGSFAAGIAAYIAVSFLDKYFQDKTLRPFAIYCLAASVLMLVLGLFRGHF